MRFNPVMQNMVCFTQKRDQGVLVFENDYHYAMGEPLQQLADYEPGSYFHVHKEERFGIRHLKEPVPGWRIKVGPYYLYLLMGGEEILAEENHAPALRLHRQLMTMKLYYPNSNDIINYWEAPEDDFNNAADYFKPEERSVLLAGLIEKTGVQIESALEMGCNVGRNLNYLKQQMEIETAGLEICSGAVDLLRQNYPDLAESTIVLGDLTQTIHQLEDQSYDLVFSMAVLMHLHPETDESFWDKVSKVARKVIITIENEHSGSERHWPRNYGEMFQSRGWQEVIHFFPIKGMPGLDGYTIRAFLPE